MIVFNTTNMVNSTFSANTTNLSVNIIERKCRDTEKVREIELMALKNRFTQGMNSGLEHKTIIALPGLSR